MKVLTVFGTRPEIIRLSQVIKQLDKTCDHVTVHTGQNYDPNLSDIFFSELALRKPDVHLGVQSGGFATQLAQITERFSKIMEQSRPDRILLLGDTNSCLTAILAARNGVPVYHMEAGNRCYDNRVPEEINRRIIDHCSDVLMPYTYRSKENLLREGIERERIFVIGNPIFEVLEAYSERINGSSALSSLSLSQKEYFLVTLHRAENVDRPQRLERILAGLSQVADTYARPMIISVHPRTANKLKEFGLGPESKWVKLIKPLGFFDFVCLEKNAFCVLSDSGTVQEECCIFHVPNVTLRDVTERAETVECGSNIIAGDDPYRILQSTQVAVSSPTSWVPPSEYLERNVSMTVAKVVLGYREKEFRSGVPGDVVADREVAAHREQ